MCSHDNAVFQSMSLTDVFANSSLPLFSVAFHFCDNSPCYFSARIILGPKFKWSAYLTQNHIAQPFFVGSQKWKCLKKIWKTIAKHQLFFPPLFFISICISISGYFPHQIQNQYGPQKKQKTRFPKRHVVPTMPNRGRRGRLVFS